MHACMYMAQIVDFLCVQNYLSCKNFVIQFYTIDHPLKKPFNVVKVSRRHSFFPPSFMLAFLHFEKYRQQQKKQITNKLVKHIHECTYMCMHKEISFWVMFFLQKD